MSERLIEIRRCYGMERNVEKTKVMRISTQPPPMQVMTDQKQLENAEYFNHLGCMITNDTRCKCEIKSGIVMAQSASNKKKVLFTSKFHFNLRKNMVNCYICHLPMYGDETWTLRREDQKPLERFKSRAGEGCRRSVGPIV
jgi:hypothetical protein